MNSQKKPRNLLRGGGNEKMKKYTDAGDPNNSRILRGVATPQWGSGTSFSS